MALFVLVCTKANANLVVFVLVWRSMMAELGLNKNEAPIETRTMIKQEAKLGLMKNEAPLE